MSEIDKTEIYVIKSKRFASEDKELDYEDAKRIAFYLRVARLRDKAFRMGIKLGG